VQTKLSSGAKVKQKHGDVTATKEGLSENKEECNLGSHAEAGRGLVCL
jgi:hypothetical protein